ncbi:ABC transporter substrate-binding protein [Shewanella gelidii]|nr:ABC transporter substrate binding protein [Shewanella gelidii]MCL1099650.1 hypothetical protein [Shewanella gelidii]
MRVLLAVLLCMTCCYANAAKILIVESYHSEYSWDSRYYQGIIDTLGDEHVYHTFQMDTKRLPVSEHAARADSAWETYLEVKPDIVILGDDNAVKYLHERLRKTTTPVVFLGLNTASREYNLNQAKNFTGIFERPLLKRSIVLAQQLLPKKSNRKVLVLFDSGTTSKASIDYIRQIRTNNFIGNTQVDIRSVDKFEDWQQRILTASDRKYDAVFVGLYHTIKDKNGNHISDTDVLRWTQKNATVPHFGFWSFSISPQGNIGGYVLDGYVHGVTAAAIARKILQGTPPNRIFPKTDSTGRYIMSRSGIKKWRLVVPDNILTRVIWVD